MGRLEEIIQESKIEGIKDETPFYFREVDEEDFQWLINRVKELEGELLYYKMATENYLDMEQQNERYKQALKTIAVGDNHVAEFWDIAKWALEDDSNE